MLLSFPFFLDYFHMVVSLLVHVTIALALHARLPFLSLDSNATFW